MGFRRGSTIKIEDSVFQEGIIVNQYYYLLPYPQIEFKNEILKFIIIPKIFPTLYSVSDSTSTHTHTQMSGAINVRAKLLR